MTIKIFMQVIISLIIIYLLWLGFVIADQLDQVIIDMLGR